MTILPAKPQELGRIRSGDQVEWRKDGKQGTRPHKLECFRLTSQNKPRLDYAAKLSEYGGEVSAWAEAPGGSQWQLYTAQSSIPVMVPPFNALSQSNEIWQGGECARRCDGCVVTHSVEPTLIGKECLCQNMGIDERLEKAKLSKAEACSTITRLSLRLPDLPGIGIWLYSTKSYYAGMELQGNAEMLQQASAEGVFISAALSIEERRVRRGGQTKVFPVVTLQAEVTMRQLLTRELPADKHIRIETQALQLPEVPGNDVVPVEKNGRPIPPEVDEVHGERTSAPQHFTPPAQPSVPPLHEDIPAVKFAPGIPDMGTPKLAEDPGGLLAPKVEPGAESAWKPLDEKQTPLQRKLLSAAMKLTREAAHEAGVSVPTLSTAVDAMAPEGFSRDYLTSKTYEDFGGWLAQVVDEFAHAAKNIPQIPPPVLNLDTWIVEVARDHGRTVDDVLAWLKEHDSQDLFGQAAGLDPFADLPECLDRLDVILKDMPVDAAKETQDTLV